MAGKTHSARYTVRAAWFVRTTESEIGSYSVIGVRSSPGGAETLRIVTVLL